MADKLRLLQCLTCKTLEEVEYYEGNPEHDFLLNRLLERHKFPDGSEHFGHLHVVDAKDWAVQSYREGIEKEIREKSGHTGFSPEYYATKNTFQEDALTCWQKHLRNPACNDYKDDSKRLTPGTAAERKAAGLPSLDRSPRDRYLCDFCPVHSLVKAVAYTKAGLRD
jgi:hypothetical protein